MTEEKKGFTVTDRRHFTAEGEVRDEEAPKDTTPVTPPQPASGAGAAPSTGDSNAASSAVPTAPARDTAPPLDTHPHRLDFTTLIVSLAAQAGLLLGDLVPPGEEPPLPDLEGAREVIDLLEDLQTRTQGRRSADEDQVLQQLLYDLRLRYVSRTGTA